MMNASERRQLARRGDPGFLNKEEGGDICPEAAPGVDVEGLEDGALVLDVEAEGVEPLVGLGGVGAVQGHDAVPDRPSEERRGHPAASHADCSDKTVGDGSRPASIVRAL